MKISINLWTKLIIFIFFKELGSQPLPTTSTEDVNVDIPRPRSGTWGSKSDSKYKDKHKSKEKNKHGLKSDSKKAKQSDSRSGSNSRSNSTERKKMDESSPKRHGFRNRSNSDASRKKGSAFMASMKSAMVVSKKK